MISDVDNDSDVGVDSDDDVCWCYSAAVGDIAMMCVS